METGKIRITTGKVDIRTLTDILNGKDDDELNKGDFGVVLISVTDDETASCISTNGSTMSLMAKYASYS